MSKDGTMLVYDPRPPETTRARLAPRLETLVGKRVLLFDNGKLDPQFRWAFPVVFEVLEGTFTRQFGVSHILHRTEYLLPATPERLSQLAEEIATLAVDAVVFALLDAGIAQPTVVLAIELRSVESRRPASVMGRVPSSRLPRPLPSSRLCRYIL